VPSGLKMKYFELIITRAYIAPGFWEEAYTEKLEQD